MFDWLFEGRISVYVMIALAVIVVWFVGAGRPRRGWYVLGLVALGGLYFALDMAVETGREEVRRKLHEMADAVAKRDVDGVMRHVAASFETQGWTATTFRDSVDDAFKKRVVEAVVVWEIEPHPAEDGTSIRVTFRAKPKLGSGLEVLLFGDATFIREADGQWRMKGFNVYNGVADTNKPLELRRF